MLLVLIIVIQQDGSKSVRFRCRLNELQHCSFCSAPRLRVSDCYYSLKTLQRCLTVFSRVMCCVVLENTSLEMQHFSFLFPHFFFFLHLNGSLFSRALILVAPEQRWHYLCSFSLSPTAISSVLL